MEGYDERRLNQYKRLHMLENVLIAKTESVMKLKPFMDAIFYIKDERGLDEFWAFMLREEGLTKTVEFIIHICSEVLYGGSEEITIEFQLYKYVSYFRITSALFSRKTLEHYLKLRAFISVEIDGDNVIFKSLRDNDAIDCRFCKALRDDDPKIVANSFFEVETEACCMREGVLGLQKDCVNIRDVFCKEELSSLSEELMELEDEIYLMLKTLNERCDMSLLYPVSLKIFVYSQKLLSSVEFYELSISMRDLSFCIQKLYACEYEAAKKPLLLCECVVGDISNWRKNILGGKEKINAHYLDASLFTSLTQIEKLIKKHLE